MSLVVELPWPDPMLSPNKSKHWAKHNNAKQAAKQKAILLTPAKKLTGDRYPLDILFYPPDRRIRDLDNLLGSMKAALDGIAEKLGIDDRQFRPITIDFGEKVKGGKVVVKIVCP